MPPLEGLLVIAIEQAVAAPLCTMRLADAGARVIKIERPQGETARHYDHAVGGTSAYFAWLNRGKESVVLDLKDSADRALAERMATAADVLVQNLAPGATQRLGLGSRELATRFPKLIAADIVGYAGETSYRHMRAYDLLVQAESGLCAVTGTPEAPCKVGVSVADIATGMNTHAAILEALLERNRTGRGRSIEISMFDGMAEWMTVPLLHYAHMGRVTARHGLAHATIYPYGPYECRDGDVLIAIQSPDEWRRFCSGVLCKAHLNADPRFADNTARLSNRSVLDPEIRSVFVALGRQEVISRLEQHQLAWAKVSEITELANHPALRHINVDVSGKLVRQPAPPLHPDLRPAPVPTLGQHTAAVRREFSEAIHD